MSNIRVPFLIFMSDNISAYLRLWKSKYLISLGKSESLTSLRLMAISVMFKLNSGGFISLIAFKYTSL